MIHSRKCFYRRRRRAVVAWRRAGVVPPVAVSTDMAASTPCWPQCHFD